MISIATTANTKIKTTTVIITAFVSLHVINHVALYMTKKAANHGTILRKNEKSPKLSLGLLIETSLANLTTDLTNDLINILQTTRITISTQKKNLKKLFKYQLLIQVIRQPIRTYNQILITTIPLLAKQNSIKQFLQLLLQLIKLLAI